LSTFQNGDIRRGMSIREIARNFHHSRRKVWQIFAESGAPTLHANAADVRAGARRFP
jgi:hypothetical protein